MYGDDAVGRHWHRKHFHNCPREAVVLADCNIGIYTLARAVQQNQREWCCGSHSSAQKSLATR